MKVKLDMHPPHWWQSEDGARLPKYLSPLGNLYGQIVKARFRYGKPYESKLPVICIGNFTLGGTGKTPLSIHLAKKLIAQGWHPTFLSRGFGGKYRGPLLVDPNDHSSTDVGDEPRLLAKAAPTVIAKDRVDGAWLIEQRRSDVIIMDDGFQNPRLRKTLSLLCLDASTAFGNERVFPAGPLRAPLDFQLAIADAVIITGHQKNNLRDRLKTQLHFQKPVFEGHVQPSDETDWLKDKPILAYAGIAQPEKLFHTLEAAGGKVIRRLPFPDHYRFRPSDAARLTKLAQEDNLQLVTTEKDLVRIEENEHHQLRALKRMSRALPVNFHFREKDEKKLLNLLRERINQAGTE